MLHELKQILGKWGLAYFNRYYSCYRGFVENNEDPKFLGRLQVRVPQITGDGVIENWAWSKGMPAGKGIGLFAIPNKGDVVWVSFEEGDPRFPIWEYGWFGTGDVPETAKNNGDKPTNYVFQSTAGHRIELDNKEGAEAIRVYDKNGYGMEITVDGLSLIVDTASGKKIFLGSLGDAAEPALLGDKTETVLNDIHDLLSDIKTTLQTVSASDTAGIATLSIMGIVLSYGANFGTLAGQMTVALTQLQADIAQIKSQKVKLD